DDRVGHTKVAPGMAAWAANNYLEAPASERFSDDRVRACAIQAQTRLNRVFPARRRKNVAHAPKVAFAFLPDVANEQQRQSVTYADAFQSCRNGHHLHHVISSV